MQALPCKARSHAQQVSPRPLRVRKVEERSLVLRVQHVGSARRVRRALACEGCTLVLARCAHRINASPSCSYCRRASAARSSAPLAAPSGRATSERRRSDALPYARRRTYDASLGTRLVKLAHALQDVAQQPCCGCCRAPRASQRSASAGWLAAAYPALRALKHLVGQARRWQQRRRRARARRASRMAQPFS